MTVEKLNAERYNHDRLGTLPKYKFYLDIWTVTEKIFDKTVKFIVVTLLQITTETPDQAPSEDGC